MTKTKLTYHLELANIFTINFRSGNNRTIKFSDENMIYLQSVAKYLIDSGLTPITSPEMAKQLAKDWKQWVESVFPSTEVSVIYDGEEVR